MRAAITHFDGDPFVLDFWLLLYKKYWRGEVDTVYANVCYGSLPDDLVVRQKQSLARFPEIKAEFIPEIHPPEWSNPRLIDKTTEDYLLLIESDGWIFGEGIVNKYLKVLEAGDYDIVGSNYLLLPPPLAEILNYPGFMRNMFFVKTLYLKSLDLDFYPRHINDYGGFDVDCFGYISYQLALKKPKVMDIPTNFVTDPQVNDLTTFPWIHIRQMNSSILGFGNAGNGIFSAFMNNDLDKISSIKAEITGSESAIWEYRKACAMRMLILYVLRDFSPYAEKYKEAVKNAIFSLNLDWDKIQGMVTYYRTIMKV